MSPIFKETFLLAKRHFAEYQRFTSAKLIEFADKDSLLSSKPRVVSTLLEMHLIGFLKRETINNVHHYWWTRQTHRLFDDDSPVVKKGFENEELEKEHARWLEKIERLKIERELIRSVVCR